jgi:hypothetical protein
LRAVHLGDIYGHDVGVTAPREDVPSQPLTEGKAVEADLETRVHELEGDRDVILEELAVFRAAFQAMSAALGVAVQPASLPTNES